MLPTLDQPVTILNDCALSAMRALPSDSVDCIITSPPYWGLRDYKIEPTAWPACSYIPMPGLEPIQVPAETSCLGLEPTLHAFLAHLVLIFEECRRVLKPTGSAWVNMGDGYAGSWGSQGREYSGVAVSALSAHQVAASARKSSHTGSVDKCPGLKPKDLMGQPWRVAFALQAAGWYLRQDNIWHKPNPMPESIRDRATKSHEYVFHLTKSERYYFDLDGWAEKASPNTHARLSQDVQNQVGSHRANGGAKTNGTMKAVCRKAQPVADGMVKNNSSMDGSLALMPITRNKRSVWTVPTAAYSEAHFATYPSALITPPLRASTSAYGCCATCGKPYERTLLRSLVPTSKACKSGVIDSRDHAADRQDQGSNRMKDGHVPGMATLSVTTGWHPTCTCPHEGSADTLVRPVVLDPFGGSGTTGEVALANRCHAILIERGAHNIALIHQRLQPGLANPVLPLA